MKNKTSYKFLRQQNDYSMCGILLRSFAHTFNGRWQYLLFSSNKVFFKSLLQRIMYAQIIQKKTISESVKWLVINNSAHMGQKQTNKQKYCSQLG